MFTVLTTTNDTSKPGHEVLVKSLQKHGYKHHVIVHPWRGFGDKVLKTYEYLKAHPEIELFLYTDAWDTMAMAGPTEVMSKVRKEKWDKIIFSAEKACYPHPEKATKYPNDHKESPWRYLNGGNWMATNEAFCRMVEADTPSHTVNDQAYFTDMLIKGYIKLDYRCELFQTIGFEGPDDFNYGVRLHNSYWNTTPVFAHGNGRTPMDKIWRML